MSLILDALKRAERERKVGQAPEALDDALPNAPAIAPAPAGRRYGGVLIALACGLLLGALGWRFLRVPAPVSASATATDATAAAAVAPAGQAPAAARDVATDAGDAPTSDAPTLARIDGADGIRSLDDLIGDDAESSDDADTVAVADTDPAADALQRASAASASAPAAPAAGPTLYRPAQPPVPAPSPAGAPDSPAAAAEPLASVQPSVPAAPKPSASRPIRLDPAPKKADDVAPSSTPTPTSEPTPRTGSATDASGNGVARAAPAPAADGNAPVANAPPSRRPRGPVVRFLRDGKTEVIENGQSRLLGEPADAKAMQDAAAPQTRPVPIEPTPAVASSMPAGDAERAAAPRVAPAPATAAASAAPTATAEPASIPAAVPTPANAAAPADRPAPEPAPAPAKAFETPPPPPVRLRPPPAPSPAIAGLKRLKDMPAAYRAGFPALSVDVHVYNDNPSRRFVLVNGTRYGERTTLAEGPVIEQIVPDGLILSWRGERIAYTLNR